MEPPEVAGTYSREQQGANPCETGFAGNPYNFDGVAKFGKTTATGGPSIRFGVAVKPRLTIPGQEQNGNFLSAWDFTGGNLNMEFSPELQENIKNGIAQIDVGSTGSDFTNSAISQDRKSACRESVCQYV